jgi:hypothetical protein
MNQTKIPDDPLYVRAKQILAANPGIGKNRLGAMLGIKAPSSRLRIVRYRGETEGHSQDPDYVRVRQLKEQHPDWSTLKIAQAVGLTVDHTKLHLARWIGAQSYNPIPAPAAATPPPPATANRDNELEDTVHDRQRDLSYRGSKIQTLDELLEYARVDRSVWEVERHTLNKYEVAARNPDGMATTTLFQIKAWLKRKVVEQQLQGVMDKLLQRFRDTAPFQPAVHYETANRRGLLELSLMDLHLGKYCSELETGRAYNAGVTRTMFETALNDLLNKAAGLRYEKLLFVVGNDFFNTDHLGRTTTAGTPQDECLRYQESFAEGKALMVRAIDHLRTLAPVEVLVVSGNHDTQRLYYLGHALQERFHNTPGVTVENNMRPRKYVRYHRNLIGFCHGHNEKHHDLPLLLATEDPQGWAQSRHREFHLGHFHSRKLKMFVPSFDRAGVLVRILPSLCPPDAWHAAMGYNARLAAEALYFDPDEGCVATFTHAPN